MSKNAQPNQKVKSQHVFEDILAPKTRINTLFAALTIITLNLKTTFFYLKVLPQWANMRCFG